MHPGHRLTRWLWLLLPFLHLISIGKPLLFIIIIVKILELLLLIILVTKFVDHLDKKRPLLLGAAAQQLMRSGQGLGFGGRHSVVGQSDSSSSRKVSKAIKLCRRLPFFFTIATRFSKNCRLWIGASWISRVMAAILSASVPVDTTVFIHPELAPFCMLFLVLKSSASESSSFWASALYLETRASACGVDSLSVVYSSIRVPLLSGLILNDLVAF
ncbi:hypothetical protein JZ751_004952 [Albula glossodonta]|uniref:Uncharacterized protein n=1 Tax=Albula glossodonta TaxID=121402 RepID=A0A8T2P489_9TELE|nr:hypothetical protein JZ751_004952 [Albula glossodonta]